MKIEEILLNGLVFDPKNRWSMTDANLISQARRLLDSLPIDRYVLVGGIAMLTYIDGRNTQDIDIIIALNDLEQIPDIRIESVDQNFARAFFGALQVDGLLTNNPLFERVRQEYVTERQFTDRWVRCATPEGIVLLKLYALLSLYHQGNLQRAALYEGDLLTLRLASDFEFNPLLSILTEFLLATDIAELTSICSDIETRIRRMRSLGNP